jgi:drug/metabolite transporter (DMT)-like permease
MLGKDELNWLKILCAMLIFTGVYMVSVSPKTRVITNLPVDAE